MNIKIGYLRHKMRSCRKKLYQKHAASNNPEKPPTVEGRERRLDDLGRLCCARGWVRHRAQRAWRRRHPASRPPRRREPNRPRGRPMPRPRRLQQEAPRQVGRVLGLAGQHALVWTAFEYKMRNVKRCRRSYHIRGCPSGQPKGRSPNTVCSLASKQVVRTMTQGGSCRGVGLERRQAFNAPRQSALPSALQQWNTLAAAAPSHALPRGSRGRRPPAKHQFTP